MRHRPFERSKVTMVHLMATRVEHNWIPEIKIDIKLMVVPHNEVGECVVLWKSFINLCTKNEGINIKMKVIENFQKCLYSWPTIQMFQSGALISIQKHQRKYINILIEIYKQMWQKYTNKCGRNIQTNVAEIYKQMWQKYTNKCDRNIQTNVAEIYKQIWQKYTNKCDRNIQTNVTEIYKQTWQKYTNKCDIPLYLLFRT